MEQNFPINLICHDLIRCLFFLSFFCLYYPGSKVLFLLIFKIRLPLFSFKIIHLDILIFLKISSTQVVKNLSSVLPHFGFDLVHHENFLYPSWLYQSFIWNPTFCLFNFLLSFILFFWTNNWFYRQKSLIGTQPGQAFRTVNYNLIMKQRTS